MKTKQILTSLILLTALTTINEAQAQSLPKPAPSKPATEATKQANAAVQQYLNFADTLTIKNAQGHVVWDLEQYKTYIGDDKPAVVEFEQSLKKYPPIAPGTPDPYTPPK